MASNAVNVRFTEDEIFDIRQAADVYKTTITQFIREAVREYLAKKKEEAFYRLTVNIEDADSGESEEVINALDALTDDDLEIANIRRFQV